MSISRAINKHENTPEKEYDKLKQSITELVYEIRKTQDHRDETKEEGKRTVQQVRAEWTIKAKISEAEEMLTKMRNILNQQQREAHNELASMQMGIKTRQFEYCKNMIDEVKRREDGDMSVSKEEQPLTLDNLKLQLVGNRERKPYVARDLYDEERDAMGQFRKKDEDMDAVVGDIENGLDDLKRKAGLIGDTVDNQKIGVGNLNKQVSTNIKEIETEHERLKRVLSKYDKPFRICSNIFCLIILIILIVVIIVMATKQ